MTELLNQMENDYSRYKCSKCKGTGEYYHCVSHPKRIERTDAVLYKCPACDGDGYLDWVENVVGKRPKLITDSSAAINIDRTASQITILNPRMHGKTVLLEAQNMIDKEIIQVMSNKIAMKIDEEIMEALGGKERG